MLQLISKSNIASVEEEGGSRSRSGVISFRGGETYSGEMNEKTPFGFGVLTLRDGSKFDGRFEGTEFVEGTLAHFSGVKFSGRFLRNRFSKGNIEFPDGDLLEGTWGPQSGLWVLKSGRLLNQDGEVRKVFNSPNCFESGEKSVCPGGNSDDFCLKWKKFKQVKGKELREFCLFSDGRASFEMFEGLTRYRFFHPSKTYLPTASKQAVSKTPKRMIWHRLSFGAEVELDCETDIAILRFECLPKVFIKGTYENEPTKFKFKGSLFDQTSSITPIGKVSIKQSVLTSFAIKLGDQRLAGLDEFFTKLRTLGIPKSDQKLSLPPPPKQSPPAPKTSSLSVLKMMVNTMMAGVNKDVNSTEASD